MSAHDDVVSYDARIVEVLVALRVLEREAANAHQLQKLGGMLRQVLQSFTDAPDAYSLSTARVRRLHGVEVQGDDVKTGRLLEVEDRALVIEVLRDVLARMYPHPARMITDDVAIEANDSGNLLRRLKRRLVWLKYLDDDLLEGLDEEALMPALTHDDEDVRRRALALLGRTPATEKESDTEHSRRSRGR